MGIDSVGLGLPDGMAGWSILSTRKATDFKALTNDPQLKSDLAYLRAKLPTKATAGDLLADQRLRRIVLQAFGLESQVGMTALVKKVLESDPASTTSIAARMNDPRYQTLTKALNYGGIAIPAIPAFASEARVAVDGIGANGAVTGFTGTFGGVSISGLVLDGTAGRSGIATQLQDAFRRADGGRSDISVAVFGTQLVFSDAKGRGTAKGFTFDTSGDATTALEATTAGKQATAAQGGPKVTDTATVAGIAARFVQARFEAAVGTNSDTLRAAIYAKRQLPQTTSWYSVIADTNLARVVRGALGLPDSFARIDVDQQVAVLKGRMSIADLKDSKKLDALLNRFVARSAAATGTDSTGGILSLLQPLSQR
ncbi:DUF1217 domain-containing protein [Paracraurococcus ruber]|uniref:Flagellar protein n=1 Tax=Paracraurococcus ruber TaxID=77675 RepID=A0ABS1CR15_9PROT|nr:DUF1217 domain-containing protein [Paracraurococcus ruber]MBK1656631.1 flagellar protein [Paracraurococcus ruber]TDG33745.1 DUF1217 domain-containing protein [Paracraurococcus ruber]